MTDYRKLAAEAFGTFTLIFIGAGSIIASAGTNLVAIALAHGIAIAVMVSALGHISGGLFNPALTIGLWVTRRLTPIDAATYIGAQLGGAIVGGLALVLLFPEQARDLTDLGTPVLGDGVDFLQGVGIEVVLTIFLMLAVFGTALDARGPKVGGLFIGLVITMDIAAGGTLTGAAMNPARALGPALASGTWDDHLVFWIGPILGAVAAALLYEYVFAEEETAAAAA
jgi:MIP family channel proteins